MRRALRRFVSKLTGKNKFIFFIVIILLCILAICLGIYIQFFYKYSESDPLMIGINIGSQKTEEEISALKAEFNSLFNNDIQINSENVRVDKIEPSNSLVYTGYDLENEDENYYSVSAKIPVINIDNDNAKNINSAIKSEFYEKANSIMRQTKGYSIYTVNYEAFVNNSILSIVIKSTLKDDDNPEKVTISTYNYDFSTHTQLSLTDLIELKETTVEAVQSTITEEIKKADTNAKIIAEQYGSTYERNLNDDMYNIENTSTFFLTQDGYVYIVYAYGNTNYTNEMDIVIF